MIAYCSNRPAPGKHIKRLGSGQWYREAKSLQSRLRTRMRLIMSSYSAQLGYHLVAVNLILSEINSRVENSVTLTLEITTLHQGRQLLRHLLALVRGILNLVT